MPSGLAWPAYIRFLAAAMVTMMAGAQSVHVFYKPLSVSNTDVLLCY